MRAKCVMVQNKNKIVKPLAVALSMFTALATLASLPPLNINMKTRPNKLKRGEPGGCGIPNWFAQAINSPVSHKLAVASRVRI